MTGHLFASFFVCQRESIVRLIAVNKKNASTSESSADESVSLVLVSAKGRVAVYGESLKLLASFTLSLSSASVTDGRTATGEESTAGTSAGQSSGGPTSATNSLFKGIVAQKVLFYSGAFLKTSFLLCVVLPGRLTEKR